MPPTDPVSRRVIYARIRVLRLPASPRAFADLVSGEGGVCGCCDKAIDPDDTSLRVKHGTRVVAMHPNCYCAWRAAAVDLLLGDSIEALE